MLFASVLPTYGSGGAVDAVVPDRVEVIISEVLGSSDADAGWLGALAGGVMGAATGAFQGFATCGPYCAVAGGVVGGAAGGYLGYHSTPPGPCMYSCYNSNTCVWNCGYTSNGTLRGW